MVSTPTGSLRLEKIGTGDKVSTWGVALDTVLDLVDASVAGWTEISVTGNVTLTSNNYVSDQARTAALHLTGGSSTYTVTIPGVSKVYVVANDCAADQILSNGTSTLTIKAGECCLAATDGSSNFKRIAPLVFPAKTVAFGAGATFAGAVDLGSNKLTSVTDPTSNQDAATKKYVDTQAFAALSGNLPGQPGNAGAVLSTDGTTAKWVAPAAGKSGLFLTTDGSTTASWRQAGFSGVNAQTSGYTVASSDREKLIRCTGSFTLTLPAASTLDAAFGVYAQNYGTGSITISPASGTVDGLASYIIYPGEVRLFYNDGTNWFSVVLNPFYKVWTTTDNGFVWPPGYQAFAGLGTGAGGGGAGGSPGNYAGGGGGGAAFPYNMPASLVTAGATTTVTIGAAGAAGAAAGGSGGAGGNSSIGALITFYGGTGGLGGASGAGGAGAGAFSGGAPVAGSNFDNPGFGGGAGGVGGYPNGYASIYGGGGGGFGQSNGGNGGKSYYGGGGGGAGGGASAGAGGASMFGGAGGAGVTSGNGNAGSAPGGGGGGAAYNSNSATGGAGARGEVRMWGII